MLYRVIDAAELPSLVSAFMETYEVVAPVKRDQGYAFETIESPDDIEPVSYTHLDVDKRQTSMKS